MRQTIIKSLPRPVPRPLLSGTRAWVIALGLLALLLLALIGRDTILAKPAAAPLRLVTVSRGTVKAQVSGTGSLVPAGQENVNFRVAGRLTEIDVKVGDRVAAGQLLGRLDSSSQQVSTDQAKFTTDGCTSGSPPLSCPTDQSNVTRDQAQLSSDVSRQHLDELSGQARINQAAAQVTAAQQRLASDQASGQARINQAAAQVTSAQDNLTVQTQARPNSIASARAQVASAQA